MQESRVPVRPALAAALLCSAGLALAAPAPRAATRALWLRPTLAGVLAAGSWALAAWKADAAGVATALLALAALGLSLTAWLVRAADAEEGEEGTDPPPPPPDWGMWEAQLRGPRDRRPVG